MTMSSWCKVIIIFCNINIFIYDIDFDIILLLFSDFSCRFSVLCVFFLLPMCFRDAVQAGHVFPGGLEFLSCTPATNLINSSLNTLGYSAFDARVFYYVVNQTFELIANFWMFVFLTSYEPNSVSPRLLHVEIFLKLHPHKPPTSSQSSLPTPWACHPSSTLYFSGGRSSANKPATHLCSAHLSSTSSNPLLTSFPALSSCQLFNNTITWPVVSKPL